MKWWREWCVAAGVAVADLPASSSGAMDWYPQIRTQCDVGMGGDSWRGKTTSTTCWHGMQFSPPSSSSPSCDYLNSFSCMKVVTLVSLLHSISAVYLEDRVVVAQGSWGCKFDVGWLLCGSGWHLTFSIWKDVPVCLQKVGFQLRSGFYPFVRFLWRPWWCQGVKLAVTGIFRFKI